MYKRNVLGNCLFVNPIMSIFFEWIFIPIFHILFMKPNNVHFQELSLRILKVTHTRRTTNILLIHVYCYHYYDQPRFRFACASCCLTWCRPGSHSKDDAGATWGYECSWRSHTRARVCAIPEPNNKKRVLRELRRTLTVTDNEVSYLLCI